MKDIHEMRQMKDDIAQYLGLGVSDRNKAIAVSVLNGETYTDVGKRFGLSAGMIRVIVHIAFREALNRKDKAERLARGEDVLPPLSVRTTNALKFHGLTTTASVRRAWEEIGERGFLRIPNFGRKSLKELVQALDLPRDGQKPVSRADYLRALETVRRYEEQNGDKP